MACNYTARYYPADPYTGAASITDRAGYGPSRPFDCFDRKAQVRRAMGESLSTFLDEFSDMLPLNTAREAARLATP